MTIQWKDAKKKLEEAKEQIVREKDNNAVMRHDMREIKAKLEDVTEAKLAAEHQLNAVIEKTAPHSNMVDELSTEKRELSGNIAALESELRTCRNESSELRQELLVKSETTAVLSAQLDAIQKKGTVVSHQDMDRYRLLEGNLARMSSRYEDLEKSLDAHNELLAEEGKKNSRLRADMAALATKDGEYRKTIDRLQLEVDAEKKMRQELLAKSALGRGGAKRHRKAPKRDGEMSYAETTNEMLKALQSQQHDRAVKETLGRLAGERMDFEESMKREQTRRKQCEQTASLLGTKVNYLQIEVDDAKARHARLRGEKELVIEQLKAQRAQNLHLHRRLGEIFDSTADVKTGKSANLVVGGSGNIANDVRDVLERAVFEWHVKQSSCEGGGGKSGGEGESTNASSSSSSKSAKSHAPTFEPKFISENELSTSSMLYAAREGNFWDIVIADGGDGSRRSSSSRRTKGEEMMTRFQMKQFMQAAQAQRDPDRAWFMIAEKVAFVMNTALATEMQAGRMCSEIR